MSEEQVYNRFEQRLAANANLRDVFVFLRVGDGARETILETLKFGKIRLRDRIVQHRVALVQSC